MTVPTAKRLISIDVLRGLTIVAMLVVNNPGRWGADWQYAPLRHAPWHGCTFTDLIFPCFLFLAGVGIPISLGRLVGPESAWHQATPRIVRRTLVLLGFGLLLHAVPTFDLAHLRIPGILQRIAVCWCLTSLLYLFAPWPLRIAAGALCLLGYHLLVTCWPIDGPEQWLGTIVDPAVLGRAHLWKSTGTYDPEGLVSTIPALATCLLGAAAGGLVRSETRPSARAGLLLPSGAALLLLGWLWSLLLPFNKSMWTSSYVLWAGGWSWCALGALSLLDGRRRPAWAVPIAFGRNALLFFLLAGLVARIIPGAWKSGSTQRARQPRSARRPARTGRGNSGR